MMNPCIGTVLLHLRAQASGIKKPNNSTYTSEQFLAVYPQFATVVDGAPVVPSAVLDMFIDLTNEVVSEQRFGKMWEYCCGLYAAHMLTLWMQGSVPEGSSADDIVAAGSSIGTVTSESADGVSYSLDTSAVQDLSGWADFKLTRFGVLYASIAKRLCKGGMYIW